MFEGTRLSYVVPGYTGHIPKTVAEQGGQFVEGKPEYHIPGYAGYIKSMKSENLFGKTYGKTTYAIQHQDYHQGQDVPPPIRYRSHLKDTFQNQNNVQLRTAAEIVGVPPKEYIYPVPPTDTAQQFFQTLNEGGLKGISDNKAQNADTDPLRLGTPLPGYTGTQKRIVASNIFGQTFAHARTSAIEDEKKIQQERSQNLYNQTVNVPPLKK